VIFSLFVASSRSPRPQIRDRQSDLVQTLGEIGSARCNGVVTNGGRFRPLDEPIKHGYVERVGNAYRVTDKVNIPDLQGKLQRRIDMVMETAKRLAELGGKTQSGPSRRQRDP
jgi:hypothetical protein